jgi:hypothetical protein
MSSVPPPSQSGVPQSGGNNITYILLAVVLLLGIGGIVAWKLTSKPDAPPPPTPTASVASSAPATNQALIDEVPLPPPIIDAAAPVTTIYTGGGGGDPCTYSVCNGNVPPGSDTERGLQVLARQTRRKCYDPALGNDPTLQGHVKVHMKIASTGAICSASVAANDMSNTSVGECAARMLMSSGHVPPPKGGCVNLDFPLNYVPMGQH